MSRLQPFGESIWYCDQDLSILGLQIGSRMTVVDLGRGKLWIHSPVRISDDLRDELLSIGNVEYVIAPNKWHHLSLNEYRLAFPEAKFFGAKGLDKKRRDFQFDGYLDEIADLGSLSSVFVEGCPMYNEVAFFHPASRTLTHGSRG